MEDDRRCVPRVGLGMIELGKLGSGMTARRADVWLAVALVNGERARRVRFALLATLLLSASTYSQSFAQQSTTPGSVFRDCETCPEMVVIPPGDYNMGTSDKEIVVDDQFPRWPRTQAVHNEQPQHKVSINKPFAIGKFPVTKGEFAFFVKTTGYVTSLGCILFRSHKYPFSIISNWNSPGFDQSDQDPVVCVNWEDANAYIIWLNSHFGNQDSTGISGPYRLPSEAEWEYAARAGSQTSRWWGNELGKNNADCEVCGSQWDAKGTAPVGSFNPNPFGLYDVLGNAAQLTQDCWNENYDHAPSQGQSWTTGDCGQRVTRGGSWSGAQWVIRSATRFRLSTTQRINLDGFRVVKELQ